ncbi:MAG: TonB C-terminal domain-containing protein [Zoogloeaceae bacterium]|jgi:colicin import membrane protein|nr:TonB C-terminal domain-containing protein [Zoogloeaceae bacterium]
MQPTDTPPEPGRKLALLFTIAMHSLLALALFLGVQWKTERAAMEVELWSPTPQPATAPPRRQEPAPVPVPTPRRPDPAPVKTPDIALQKDKKEEKTPPKPSAPDFRDLLRQEEREIKDRERAAQEARLRAEADTERRAAGLRAVKEDWVSQIGRKIRGNIVLPLNIQGNPEAVFKLALLPNGEVIRDSVRLKVSSGNAALDAAIERAIAKSSPLPKPTDPAAFQRELEIIYRPYESGDR